MLQEGLQSAIDAGVDCLGITNLCAPKAAVDMMPRKTRWGQVGAVDRKVSTECAANIKNCNYVADTSKFSKEVRKI